MQKTKGKKEKRGGLEAKLKIMSLIETPAPNYEIGNRPKLQQSMVSGVEREREREREREQRRRERGGREEVKG